MRAARFVTGWLTAEISGAQPEKYLQALAERGMTFWDATPPKDFVLRVSLPLRWAKLVEPIAQNVGCQATIVGSYGLPAMFQKLKKRRALLICLVLALALLLTSWFFVWDISISGMDDVDEGALRAALAEAGVDVGAYWPSFNQDLIRNSVLLKMPTLRWVTVNIRGSHAEVIVRPDREAAQVLDEDVIVRIVADTAGLITDVRDKRGTALVSPGQTVLAGDTLIEALATGRYDVQGVTRAVGEVWARTWYELSACAPVEEKTKTYTGSGTTHWSLIFGKKRINISSGGSICPSECDKITTEYKLAIKGLFTLPVALVRESYQAYTVTEQAAQDQQLALKQALEEELADRIGDDGEVISAVFTVTEADGLLVVTLRAECKQQIGKIQILSQEEIDALQSQTSKPTEDKNL